MRHYKKKDQWQKKTSWQRSITYREGEFREPEPPKRDEKPSDRRDVYHEKAIVPEPKVIF
jgi:hypothetical protein